MEVAAELAPGIRVNALAPTITDTPLAGRLLGSEEKRRAAAARDPPLTVPGFRRHFHDWRFEAVVGVARYDVKAPGLVARGRVVGGHVTANAELGARLWDAVVQSVARTGIKG